MVLGQVAQQSKQQRETWEQVRATPLPSNKRCALGDATLVERSAQDNEEDPTMEDLADPSVESSGGSRG